MQLCIFFIFSNSTITKCNFTYEHTHTLLYALLSMHAHTYTDAYMNATHEHMHARSLYVHTRTHARTSAYTYMSFISFINGSVMCSLDVTFHRFRV